MTFRNKKTALTAVGAAVALACGSASFGASITATAVTGGFSAQGNAQADPTSIFTASVVVTLGADYLVNDTVALGAVNHEFFGGTSTVSGVSAFNTPVECTGGSNTMTLGYLSRSTTSANYRVTGVAGTQNAALCTFSLPVRRTSLSLSNSPRVSWSAATGQQAISFDESAVQATLGSVATQFVSPSSVTTLNATVDVDSSRYQFTADDGSGLLTRADTLSFTLNNRPSQNGAATITSIVAVISGDFSFVDTNGTAGCQASDLTGGHGRIRASSGTLTISSDCDELTYTSTSTAAVNIALGTSSTSTTPTSASILDAPQSFAVTSLTYNYGGFDPDSTNASAALGSSTVAFSTTGSAGAWRLNGSIVKIPYMPYASGISRIVYLTNRSTQTGAISVTAINDSGVECSAFSGGTAIAEGVTNLSAALDAGVAACYGADFAGKVAFEVTSNVPDSDTEIYSAYNVSGNRVSVINDSNGK